MFKYGIKYLYLSSVNFACTGNRDSGNRWNRHCDNFSMREMWYYDGRRRDCLRMNYLGCGGNGNRYCSRNDCMRRCRR